MTILDVFFGRVRIPIVWAIKNHGINGRVGLVDFTIVIDLKGGIIDSCKFGVVNVGWGGLGVVEVGSIRGDNGWVFLSGCFGES